MSKTIATVQGDKKQRLTTLMKSGLFDECDLETRVAFLEEGRILDTWGGKLLFGHVSRTCVRTR